MNLPFFSKATYGGRLFWYILPVACILWITLFFLQEPSQIISIVVTTSYAPAVTSTTNSSSNIGESAVRSGNYSSIRSIYVDIDDRSSNSSIRSVQGNIHTRNSNSSIRSVQGNIGIRNSSSNNSSEVGITAAVAVPESQQPPPTIQLPPDQCSGRYVYVHDLPRRFNEDLLKDCRTLSSWTDMCLFTSNAGLGPRLGKSGGVFSGSGCWYATNQFALDVIFYNRMKQYACLTNDSSQASAVFVPFFAGLDVGRYLWGHKASARDSASLDLVRWLRSRPEWEVMGGRDHFFVAGRILWDFRRLSDSDSDWGNKLLLLPEVKNMSVLVLETSPWNDNVFSIPYPTYFHPSKDGHVSGWQKRMRRTKRPWLFSFVGAPRPSQNESIRGRLIEQCRGSRRCSLLDCSSNYGDCHSPGGVIGAFQSSSFCLQPPGDSYTRKSAFDAMVAGCVPVFFHPGSAYEQYRWHLPGNHRSYSVLIPEEEVREGKVSIEERLGRIPEREVRAMREEVIKMIPRLVYANPKARETSTVKDAFEVALEGVIERVDRLRKEMRSGEVPAAPKTTEEPV
ncbi:hypothetical protein Taro_019578 [Colocasia esculenta]|uniref:Exostosin GT47 domain-containing protein n=1 Tax=Colocasia esculenta TaxID=4460 RepID=A0A843V2L8_COLES|nr:hypothetical protein [Colocasia esculenta]